MYLNSPFGVRLFTNERTTQSREDEKHTTKRMVECRARFSGSGARPSLPSFPGKPKVSVHSTHRTKDAKSLTVFTHLPEDRPGAPPLPRLARPAGHRTPAAGASPKLVFGDGPLRRSEWRSGLEGSGIASCVRVSVRRNIHQSAQARRGSFWLEKRPCDGGKEGRGRGGREGGGETTGLCALGGGFRWCQRHGTNGRGGQQQKLKV